MDTSTSVTNNSSLQISQFILMGLPGIHEWQHWLSLPLVLLYILALGANLLIFITILHEPCLHEPMYHLLGILAVVDVALATTITPKILAIFWFDAKVISLPECFVQIYAIHFFFSIESGMFLCMAVDRYIAICQPLRYSTIVTKAFMVKVTGFMVLRSGLLTIPVPVLAAQRLYCSKNEIDHCLCSNLGVTTLACDDITVNKFYQLILAWTLVGSDMALVFSSYALILHTVLRLNSAEAMSKALSTCSSHLILILFFYTGIAVLSVTHLAEKKIPLIPALLNVLHNVIPPALNPMVYALRTHKLRLGFQRLLRLGENMSTK
ncbi:olfactory receptor 56B4-like [Rousettus aegyptiacus]|uniref:Olfactory receptor family 56 subfamily B member 4 n=1 Tax=Rousettus aegyptiacus TaxID=9407 RepID=A0A7J8H532_ROUAE|nr:olfactory receptor 56B4-like [Rousettus aegyptiacus]KAF6466832.1 olfactory receptor family 56 subfamily B member 4 [Rousettus aegyptiacus]